MPEPIKEVKLRNGTVEAEPIVIVTMLALKQLSADLQGFIAIYELNELCKNPAHKPFGKTIETLQKLALVQSDGSVHNSIRNVVLSAVKGEGTDLHLESPIRQ